MPRPTSEGPSRKLATYAAWERHYAQVAAFMRERGHGYLGTHPAGEWLERQQRASFEGRLSPERQQRLALLGITFGACDEEWDRMLQRLRDEIIRRHVPRNEQRRTWLPEPRKGDLAAWLCEQRARHLRDSLRRDRVRKLRSLQLLAEVSAPAAEEKDSTAKARNARLAWERGFRRMEAFQHEHGHCLVPKAREDPALVNWVVRQRRERRRGAMAEERIRRLDAIGFDWNGKTAIVDFRWRARYEQLVAFKEKHGHTTVQEGYDKQLWLWRDVQRVFRRKGVLSAERIALLDAIGFEWEKPGEWGKSRAEKREFRWNARYDELAASQRAHGRDHFYLERKRNPKLADWVAKQITAFRQGWLRPDRKARLDALGHGWLGRLGLETELEKAPQGAGASSGPAARS